MKELVLEDHVYTYIHRYMYIYIYMYISRILAPNSLRIRYLDPLGPAGGSKPRAHQQAATHPCGSPWELGLVW